MSIALLTGLGGMFAGAAQGYQQAQDRAMRNLLLNAQLTQMGATQGNGPSLDVPQATPDQVAPGLSSVSGPTPAPNLNAPPPIPPGVLAQAQAQSQAGQGVAGQIPSSVVAQGLVSPSAGVVPQTASGTTTPQLPTDQASIIRMNRAAQGGSGGSMMSAGPATAGSSSLLAALNAANAQVPSGTPTKGAAPTGADTIGGSDSGIDPGLASVLAQYKAAMTPGARVPIGGKWTMPQVLPPQQAAMQQGILQVLANAAERQAAYKQAQTLQAQQIGSAQTISENEITAANYRADKENQIQVAHLDLATKQMEAMMQRYGTGLDTKAVASATSALKPIEGQAQTIQSAIDELDVARAHPSAANAASLQTYLAQAATGSAQLRSSLIEIAGGAPDESLEGKITRAASMLSTGKVPPAQLNDMQAALTAQRSALAKQYDSQVLAQSAAHPESPALMNVLSARKALAFPGYAQGAAAGAPTGAATAALRPVSQAQWTAIQKQHGLTDQQMAQYYSVMP